ncbi:MAG TPA: S4 domain-containing protein [Candidatus Binatia bacterium]|nr:S4 domain-containing protein [Candidatus Binatia bacterium]
MTDARQRVDVWLHRARFAKTRGAAARLIAEGGVRVVRDGASRVLDKASAEIAVGDALLLPLRGALRTVRVEGLGERRGPAAEARQLYSELDAQALA